jgi:hypothetical protein
VGAACLWHDGELLGLLVVLAQRRYLPYTSRRGGAGVAGVECCPGPAHLNTEAVMAAGSKHKRWTQQAFARDADGKDKKYLSCPSCGKEDEFEVYLQRPLRRSGTVHKIAAYAKCVCGDVTRISAGWAK